MSRAHFSKTILMGLEKRGVGINDAAKIVGVTTGRLHKILQEQASLTSKQIHAIERATGMSDGQLAASVVDKPGGPLAKLMDRLAELMPPSGKRPPRSPARKGTKKSRSRAAAHV